MSEWMEWGGGEPPVHRDTVVEVRLRNGSSRTRSAGSFIWARAKKVSDVDIVAYRFVDQGEEIEMNTAKTNPAKADDRQVSGSHYKDMPIQPWHVMEAVLTTEEFVGYLKGNIIKYSMRAGRKEGSDDTGKAEHYMQKLNEVKVQW